MKTILIFIDWFLPGYKAGGPITSNANLVNHLKDTHQFYILTSNTDYCESIPYSNVEPDKWLKAYNAEIFYISNQNRSIKLIKQQIQNIKPDVIFINGIYSYWFSLLPLLIAKRMKHPKIIVSSRGMMSPHTFSSKSFKKRLFYSLVKSLGFYNNITIHVTNKEEGLHVKKIIGEKARVHVASNLPPVVEAYKPHPPLNGEVRFISVARISPEKNNVFAIEQLVKINTTKKIILDLYGPEYNREYANLCRKIANEAGSNIVINFKGPVSKERLPEVLSQSHFFIMPSLGENFGHSILEAMLAGCPVLISDKTPWRNLEEKGVGWDISLSNITDWQKVLLHCSSMNNDQYQAMSRKAYEYARLHATDPEIISANRQLFHKV